MYDDQNQGTYLEDFILSLEILPNKFRRDLELVSFELLGEMRTFKFHYF
jgi:hypothetical protein